jgi:hypothetical protein
LNEMKSERYMEISLYKEVLNVVRTLLRVLYIFIINVPFESLMA